MKTTIKREVKPFTTERLLIAIDNALEFAKENQFILRGQLSSSYKEIVVEKLKTEASSNMRKRLNKSMRRMENKTTRKSINLFFHYLNKRLGLNMPIKFEMSSVEQEVVNSRKSYKLLKQQMEEARVKYKDLKKSYYGSGKESTEYMEK